MSNYILTFNPFDTGFTHAQMHAFVTNNKLVDSWHAPYTGTYLLKSRKTAQELSDNFREMFNGSPYFVSFLMPAFCGGALLPTGWQWLNSADTQTTLQGLLSLAAAPKL